MSKVSAKFAGSHGGQGGGNLVSPAPAVDDVGGKKAIATTLGI
jgi:hypothetical protein